MGSWRVEIFASDPDSYKKYESKEMKLRWVEFKLSQLQAMQDAKGRVWFLPTGRNLVTMKKSDNFVTYSIKEANVVRCSEAVDTAAEPAF